MAVVVIGCGQPDTLTDPSLTPSFQSNADCGDQNPLFGPETFMRSYGGPEVVTRDFCIDLAVPRTYVLTVHNGGQADDAARVSAAIIAVNGSQVLGPSDFDKNVEQVSATIRLQSDNELSVQLFGDPGSAVSIVVSSEELSTRGEVSPDGGVVELAGVAISSFPANAFTSTQTVELSVPLLDERTGAAFDITTVIFAAGPRLSYGYRITAPDMAPTSVTLMVHVPDYFLAALGADFEAQLYAMVLEDTDYDLLDHFELFESTYDPVQRTITAELPSWAFTNRRRSDGEYEAVVVLGSTPRFIGSVLSTSASVTEEDCGSLKLGAPLQRELDETGGFNTDSTKGRIHHGQDLLASQTDSVIAAASGTVELVGFEGTDTSGWGYVVVIKHGDSGTTLYAHLKEGSIPTEFCTIPDSGDRFCSPSNISVETGDYLGLADNSGGSDGNHLHWEYAPDGQFNTKKSKRDPSACVVPVASVVVAPPTLVIPAGETSTFTVTVADADGNILTDRRIRWSSSDPSVATVSVDGLVTAIAQGSAAISAAVEARSGTGTVQVPLPQPVNVAGVWTGTVTLGSGFWTWTLAQEGTSISGTTYAPSLGIISGTVTGNTLSVSIGYPATGAVNIGVLAVSGNTMSGNLTLIIPGGITVPFSTTLTRASALTATAGSVGDGGERGDWSYNADGTTTRY